ncbi:MAG: hypothetical protein QOK04_261 [Solirubrobacteraceae bacterium]|nr:hypothetical protein [Solirubrobacteraceae bacterium]
MRQQEAEEEAERRNATDERRERLVFYAFDESAGLAEDAWEVSTRLRRPEEFVWELPAPADPKVTAVPPDDPVPVAAPAPAAEVEVERGFEPEPGFPQAEQTEPPEPADAPAPARAARPRARRKDRLLRAWGYFVMLVGTLFIAGTLTVWLGFRSYLQIGAGVIVGLVAAGVFAIWVGAQIARPPHGPDR